jgi:hypothetical protein
LEWRREPRLTERADMANRYVHELIASTALQLRSVGVTQMLTWKKRSSPSSVLSGCLKQDAAGEDVTVTKHGFGGRDVNPFLLPLVVESFQSLPDICSVRGHATFSRRRRNGPERTGQREIRSTNRGQCSGRGRFGPFHLWGGPSSVVLSSVLAGSRCCLLEGRRTQWQA